MPNSHTLPLLAPAFQPGVCPHPLERWELRTRPFGCRVSSTTSLAVLAAVAATAVAAALLALLGAVALLRRRRHATHKPHGRHGAAARRWQWARAAADGSSHGSERAPLLANARGAAALHLAS